MATTTSVHSNYRRKEKRYSIEIMGKTIENHPITLKNWSFQGAFVDLILARHQVGQLLDFYISGNPDCGTARFTARILRTNANGCGVAIETISENAFELLDGVLRGKIAPESS